MFCVFTFSFFGRVHWALFGTVIDTFEQLTINKSAEYIQIRSTKNLPGSCLLNHASLQLALIDNASDPLWYAKHVSFFSRLLIYIERDLCEATPLRENPNQSAYLSQCLDLLVVHLNNTASMIMGTHNSTFLTSLVHNWIWPFLVDLVGFIPSYFLLYSLVSSRGGPGCITKCDWEKTPINSSEQTA